MSDSEVPCPAVQSLGGHEIELTRDLELSGAQTRLLEMHSVDNVLNALIFRIEALGHLTAEVASADRLMDELLVRHAGLEERTTTLAHLRRVPELRARLIAWLDRHARDTARSGACARPVLAFASPLRPAVHDHPPAHRSNR